MKRSRVAKRYARALFELAVEKKQLDVVETDLKLLQDDYQQVEEFQQLMDSPVIPGATKQKVFAEAYKSRLQENTFSFVAFLITKNRESLLEDVILDFYDLLDDHRGIIRGDVYSVVALSDAQVKSLKARLDEITGKNVIFSQKIDENLLGGFVVKIDDMVYDTSLRNQLEVLRRNLVES